ncbi:MAG: geranylgeranylglycerol-phosphate geranylgeranyltransferase [Flammeovirgaceae bacterium]
MEEKNRRGMFVPLMKVVRLPNLMMIGATEILVRIFMVGKKRMWLIYFQDTDFYVLIFSSLLIAAAGYIINDYYDIKIDIINNPQRVVIGKTLSRRKAMFAHTAFNFLGIGIGLLLSWKIGMMNLIGAYLLWLYSNHLKRLPLIGNATVALLSTFPILVVAIFYSSPIETVFIFSLFAFYITLVRQIIKDMKDMRGDKHFGSKTLPILWGIRKTKSFLYALMLVYAISTGLLLHLYRLDKLRIYFMIMVLPALFFVYQLFRADTVKQFHLLSQYCKLAIVSGIIAIMLV